MSSEEKTQYLKAITKLESEKNLRRIGKADEAEISKLELVVAQFRALQKMPNQQPKPVLKTIQAGFVSAAPMESLPPEVAAIIDKFREEQSQIDIDKNRLSNSLYKIPDNVNCKAVVQQIKRLREAWVKKGDEIRFVMQHGQLPTAINSDLVNELEFTKSLPTDLLDLDRKIKNRLADLSKYKKRLQMAKTDVAKLNQEINISKANIEINLMRTQLNILK